MYKDDRRTCSILRFVDAWLRAHIQGGIWRRDGWTYPGHWTSGSPSLEL